MNERVKPSIATARAIGALLLAVLAGCGGSSSSAADPTDPADFEQGRTLYEDFCASCHSSDGSGAVGPSLADGRVADRVGGVPELSVVISEGGDRMPGLKSRLTTEQIEIIARYVLERL